MLDGAHRTKRYVIFSATSRSPTSYVGYMDSEGMKRGSATNLRAETLSRRAGPHTLQALQGLQAALLQIRLSYVSGMPLHTGTCICLDQGCFAGCTAQKCSGAQTSGCYHGQLRGRRTLVSSKRCRWPLCTLSGPRATAAARARPRRWCLPGRRRLRRHSHTFTKLSMSLPRGHNLMSTDSAKLAGAMPRGGPCFLRPPAHSQQTQPN